jgi:hypothetical protein
MHLTDASSTTLSLTISGYQFPAMETEPHDSNWLNVVGTVEHPRGPWSFHDPCLLTYELEWLCDWLERVAADPVAEHPPEYFTEPNLEFHVIRSGGAASLRVHLSHEASPPWIQDRADRLDGVDLDFPLPENDVRAAAKSLRACLSKYPQRAQR